MISHDLVERAIKKKKQEQELRRGCLLVAANRALDRLALIISFDQAYIFGSASKPFGFNALSDLDIGFYGLKDQDFFAAKKQALPRLRAWDTSCIIFTVPLKTSSAW